MRQLFYRSAAILETMAALCLAIVTLVVFVSALGRYLFAAPIPDAFDVSRFLLGIAIAWGFAVLGLRGGHICVDLLAEAMPPGVRRGIEIIAQTVLLGFTILLAWRLFGRVDSAFASNESTFDLQLPVWPFLATIWAGFAAAVATTLAGLVVLLRGGELDLAPDAEEQFHE